MDSQVDEIENFCGVYLLKSLNAKYRGWTYIGYTVDPNRRVKQHNRGKKFGGAWRTSKRGPWEMVLIVHGFPNNKSALTFEWAWQHPKKSRRLKNIIAIKKKSEKPLDYKIRVMFTMLSTPPWNRLPLILRWLSADAAVDAPPSLRPPSHMPVTYGTMKTKKVKHRKMSDLLVELETELPYICQICLGSASENDLLKCVNTNCKGLWHIFCIANIFLKDEEKNSTAEMRKTFNKRKRIIPVEGPCPQCKFIILWGDLIRKKQGSENNVNNFNDSSFLRKQTIIYETEVQSQI